MLNQLLQNNGFHFCHSALSLTFLFNLNFPAEGPENVEFGKQPNGLGLAASHDSVSNPKPIPTEDYLKPKVCDHDAAY